MVLSHYSDGVLTPSRLKITLIENQWYFVLIPVLFADPRLCTGIGSSHETDRSFLIPLRC